MTRQQGRYDAATRAHGMTRLSFILLEELSDTLKTPKRIPFFQPYAWSTWNVFYSLPGAVP